MLEYASTKSNDDMSIISAKIKSGIRIEELQMSIPTTGYEHIVINDNKVPIIAGTNMKVVELVLEHIAFGWAP